MVPRLKIMDKVNIKYIMCITMVTFSISVCNLVFVVSAEKAVHLKLKTTSCKNSCKHFSDGTCPSSIKVDNVEQSKQQDGFNVVVINNYSGRVVERKFFRWFNNLMFWKRTAFKRFFKNIRHNSTVIIVFQNMCKELETEWYENLKDLKHNIPKKLNSYQSVVIACKGTCPAAEHEKIPYSYYYSGIQFEKSITLLFRAAGNRIHNGKDSLKNKDYIAETIGGIVGVVFFMAIIYSFYIYSKRRLSTLKDSDISVHYKETEQSNTTENNEPIYEPLITKVDSNESPYEVVDQTRPPPYNYNYKGHGGIGCGPPAPPLSGYPHIEHHALGRNPKSMRPVKPFV